MIGFCRSPDAPGVHVIDIRSTAEHPYCGLSFDYQHGQIPVPGLLGNYSDSVTGLFEALRLIGPTGRPGRVNYGYFAGPGRERRPKPDEWATGWAYRGRCLDEPEARRKILIPAYLWVVSNKASAAVSLIRRMADQRSVGLFDGYVSGNIEGSQRLSAAAVLAAYLDGRLDSFLCGADVLDN